MLTKTVFLPLFFLIGTLSLLAVRVSIRKLRPVALQQEFAKHPFYYSFYRLLENLVMKGRENPVLDFLNLTSFITIVSYGIAATLYLLSHQFYSSAIFVHANHTLAFYFSWFLLAMVLVLAIPLVSYFLIHLLSSRVEYFSLRFFAWSSTLFLIVYFPITWPLIWVEHRLLPKNKQEGEPDSIDIKDRLLEFLQESDVKDLIHVQDKRLIKSIASFRNRVAREIMVPKIDLVALEETISIENAAATFVKEGFSRIPIYNGSIDLITGLLLYKDVLAFLLESPQKLTDTSVKMLAKPIIYAPEGKKIADLLQEMKQAQTHIIVVVNEYGCTEGIVTIEDILEEIVGEIADEHDVDEALLYSPTSDNAWIVDARMNIIDLETETGVSIPPDPEYETVGGFILHQINSFPSVGTTIHTDHFDVKVLSTGKRQIYKVKIVPLQRNSSTG